MAESQTVRRRAGGLFTHPNALEVPPGSLLVADNAVIDREWTISKRRGYKRYGQALPGPARTIFEFKKRLIVHEGDRLYYDSDDLGTWVAWAGNFLDPAAGILIRPVETSGVLLFPTFSGTWRQDALTSAPRRAGVHEALDYEVEKIGTGGTDKIFAPDTALAYRILWGRKDVNGNVLTGTPSHREEVQNIISGDTACALAAGVVTVTMTAHGFLTGDKLEISSPSNPAFELGEKTITVLTPNTFTYPVTDAVTVASGTVRVAKHYNLRLTFRVPPDVVAGDFYEIYRTIATVGAGVDPGETFKRVRQAAYVSGTTVTFDDDVPDSQLDLALYTNDTEEGPNQTNDRPGHCRFMAFFKTHTFYAYCQKEQAIEVTLNTTDGITAGVDTITVNASGSPLTYTFATAENQALRHFRLFTEAELGTDQEAVERTMKSFQKIVNADTPGRVFVFYRSGSDEAAGKVEIRARDLQTDPFTVVSTIGTDFTPSLAAAQTSVADVEENAVYRSKSDQPDSVPRLNRHKIGRKNKAILGLLANRDALFVLKEDGLFTITGESDGGAGFSFLVDEQDPVMILRGLNTLVGLDNALFAFTSQGGTRVTQGNSSVFSRQVEIDLNVVANLGLFGTNAFGVAYESDRKYLLSVPGGAVWCFNYLTNAWTRWLLPVTMGYVHSTRDRLYWAHSREPYILEERKNLSSDGLDQQDEDLDVTVTAFSTTTLNGFTVSLVTVTHTYFEPIESGWWFTQGFYEARVAAVTVLSATSFRLTLAKNLTALTASAAVVSKPVRLRIIWTPESVGSAGTIKQFPGVQTYHEDNSARHSRLGFLADTQASFEYIQEVAIANTTGWGLQPWGMFPWGSPRTGRSTPIRTMVPQDHQRCRALTLLYENTIAREQVNLIEVAYDARPFGTRAERQPN